MTLVQTTPKKIYMWVEEQTPYTPTSDTVYYFPFTSNADDYSGNWYTLSNTWTATTIWRNFTATVDTSPAGSTISNPAFRMAWVKVNNVWYESRKVNSMGMNVSDWLAIHFMNGWVGSSQPIQINFDYVNWSSYSSSSWQPWITTWNWYCIAFQNEWTDTVAYCNWVRHVMASWKTGYYWWAPSYLSRESSASSWFSVDLSEIIMESATWTSTKVIDYFNATKSKYWVS